MDNQVVLEGYQGQGCLDEAGFYSITRGEREYYFYLKEWDWYPSVVPAQRPSMTPHNLRDKVQMTQHEIKAFNNLIPTTFSVIQHLSAFRSPPHTIYSIK